MHRLTPKDFLEIERLYARYNEAIRHQDGEAWAACFTASGTFSNRRERVTGRDALVAYGTAFSSAANARYWVNNLLLEPTDDGGVAGTCYLEILHVGQEQGPRISLTGIYTDTLVRDADEWKYASRHIARDE